MTKENEDFDYSDEEIDEHKHQKLVDAVLTLNKVQKLKRASRSEPTLKTSEFHLVKSITGEKGIVHPGDSTKSFSNKSKLLNIKRKLEKSKIISRTIPKPLEKPTADRIRRTVAYEKTRLELDRWEPVITSNRVSTNLVFPLNTSKLEEEKNDEKRWKLKTIVDLEEEKMKPLEVEEIHVDVEKEKFPMTMKEIMEHRKEEAKLRAHQSYKEAKARRQNKIKSKNYHRIQRREKIKQQLKEFELLQKTDPEEALKKLDEIERIRAQERFSLRHKSTGKWAKNKQIRAKYDKESRQELAQQLTLSKELTQKICAGSDSEEEVVLTEQTKMNSTENNNPWLDNFNIDKEVTSFVNNYKKYWSEKNEKIAESNVKHNEIDNESQNDDLTENQDQILDILKTSPNTISEHLGVPKKYGSLNTSSNNISLVENTETNYVVETQEEINLAKKNKRKLVPPNNNSSNNILKISLSKKNKNKSEKVTSISTSEWNVDAVEGDGIDVVFDKLEKSLENKLQKKLTKLQTELKGRKSKKKNKTSIPIESEQPTLLTLPIQKKVPQIDEPLSEGVNNDSEPTDRDLNDLKKILEKKQATDIKKPKEANIDPNQFMKLKVTQLNTELPDILTNADDDDLDGDSSQQELIAEAFQDDNVIEEFSKEKTDEIEKHKPKDLNLMLPGWGSWGGTGIVPSKRKQKRFIVKAPKKLPRRDDNKGFLIINEDATKKTKEHMVDELPFPFQRVRDFESSIRAPVGRTFVPETAFQKLIQPAVRTKIGAIIEPMHEDVLLKIPS